jgi:hypothetical protein
VSIGGIINTSGGGLFTVTSTAANYLNGVTLNGNLDMASIANSRERVTAGGLVRSTAPIDINSNGILSFEGDGASVATAPSCSVPPGPGNRIDLDGNGTTTFASGTTVRGPERHHRPADQHRRHADAGEQRHDQRRCGAAARITITDSAVTNNGTLSALNGGTLVLSSNVTGGASGQIVAGAGSTVAERRGPSAASSTPAASGLFTVTAAPPTT